MKKFPKLFLSIIILGLIFFPFSGLSAAKKKGIDYCVKISNIDQYSDFTVMLISDGPLYGYDIFRENECIVPRKTGQPTLIAIPNDKFNEEEFAKKYKEFLPSEKFTKEEKQEMITKIQTGQYVFTEENCYGNYFSPQNQEMSEEAFIKNDDLVEKYVFDDLVKKAIKEFLGPDFIFSNYRLDTTFVIDNDSEVTKIEDILKITKLNNENFEIKKTDSNQIKSDGSFEQVAVNEDNKDNIDYWAWMEKYWYAVLLIALVLAGIIVVVVKNKSKNKEELKPEQPIKQPKPFEPVAAPEPDKNVPENNLDKTDQSDFTT